MKKLKEMSFGEACSCLYCYNKDGKIFSPSDLRSTITGNDFSNDNEKITKQEYIGLWTVESIFEDEEKDITLEEKYRLEDARTSIIDAFEDILDRHNIFIPDAERTGAIEESNIYGDTYFELEDKIFEILKTLKKNV